MSDSKDIEDLKNFSIAAVTNLSARAAEMDSPRAEVTSQSSRAAETDLRRAEVTKLSKTAVTLLELLRTLSHSDEVAPDLCLKMIENDSLTNEIRRSVITWLISLMVDNASLESNETFIEDLLTTEVRLIGDLKPRFATSNLPINDRNSNPNLIYTRCEIAKTVLSKLELALQDPKAIEEPSAES